MTDSREYAVAGETYTNILSLVPAGGGDTFQASPTIAAGDFVISTDGGATFENMDNLPAVVAGSTKVVSYTVSAAETTAAGAGGLVMIVGSDAAGAEWQDVTISIPVRGEDVATVNDIPTAAATADAVWDEATSGHIAAGSFGLRLADLADQSSVTVVTAVSGSTVTVYTDSYWSFAISGLGDTSGYETLLLTVKASTGTADSAAHLYLRSDTGLIAIGTGAPSSAGNGALTNDGTGFTATVEMAETAGLSEARNLTWWLKGLDTTPDPDTGTVIATGEFNILASGAKATS